MIWTEFTPKTWEETDVDIKVTHSGICGTDLHTLRSGWVDISHRSACSHVSNLVRAQQIIPSSSGTKSSASLCVSAPRPLVTSKSAM